MPKQRRVATSLSGQICSEVGGAGLELCPGIAVDEGDIMMSSTVTDRSMRGQSFPRI